MSSPEEKAEEGKDLICKELKTLISNGIKGAIYRNCLIPTGDSHKKADVLFLTRKALYVILSRYRRGTISGTESGETWTQKPETGKDPFSFANPLIANQKRCEAMKGYFGQSLKMPIISVIVFVGECELKEMPSATDQMLIVRLPELAYSIFNFENIRPDAVSEEDWNDIRKRLSNLKTAAPAPPVQQQLTPEERAAKQGHDFENEVEKALKSLDIEGKAVLSNLQVPKKGKEGKDWSESAEIDILYLTRKAIFVIECKDWGGYIRGKWSDPKWTQTFEDGGKEESFDNPVQQNRGHCRALNEYLLSWEISMRIPIVSVICFSDRCTLKEITVPPGCAYGAYVVQMKNLKELMLGLTRTVNVLDNYSPPISGKDFMRLTEILGRLKETSPVLKEVHIEQCKKIS